VMIQISSNGIVVLKMTDVKIRRLFK